MRWALVFAVACSPAAAPPTELETIEKPLKTKLTGVVIAPSGTVYVDRIAVDDVHLPEAIAKMKSPTDPIDVYLLGGAHPAPGTIATLQIIAEKYPYARLSTTNAAGTAQVVLCDRVALLREPVIGEPGLIRLSVLFDTDQIVVVLSRVRDVEQIRRIDGAHDLQRLELRLGEHRHSELFGRSDLELSAEPKVSAADYASGFAVACKVGFTQLSILRADKLSARPDN